MHGATIKILGTNLHRNYCSNMLGNILTEETVINIKVQIISSLNYKRHILHDSITKHIVGVMKEVII